ncbi:hypothetical protein GH714_010530 [Hevea brasiliensis]|uniref:Methyltransferase type 11 domain-containing protein n=1 Tax=Hevea brasiliensis TaxID=3981 RepID=A0A6A6KQG0_HEVBR|nr:hypothetical protein GH714_010530 [Hevea brasiliensis]
MINVTRASRSSRTNWESVVLPILESGSVFHSGIFKTMREVKVKVTESSGLCTLSFNGESVSVAEQKTCSSSSTVQSTPEIEKKYVHRVYDAIAPHFSSTRYAKWPKVATFLNSLPSGSLILDAGCGNGKYLGLNPDCFYIGCDISAPLIKICADRGHEVLVGDAINLPYRTGFGDAAISIAVLHHLSTENRRKKAIEELVRVVKKGGLVLITVWAVEQEDGSLVAKWTPLTEKYVEEWIGPGSPRVRSPSCITLESIPETEENNNSKEHVKDNRSSGASACALASGLAKKDDIKGAVVYNRYYHVFSEGELGSEMCLVHSGVGGEFKIVTY